MPSESTSLQEDEPYFRSVERTSNLRANIFLFECMVVMSLYIFLLYAWRLEYSSQVNLLAAFGAIYMIRVNIMSRWLLPRELGMEEITVVILFISSIMGSYVILAKEISSVGLAVSSILYAFGSYLNTWSEMQRKFWKGDPANKGRCYTLGLFSWSRNINYFGDSMLFAGWAVATGNWVNSWAPIVMSLAFYFFHIPEKEKYLAIRYAKDWPAYLTQTPYAFIPYIC
eukprot:CAMPEP_0171299264 /NCGR_PEP_ID=MMETSP0816-20121228/8071_1 /TAXON_ID=420281 /ORGANISM="Proboscia inermis, Strain CCAP1064/1" /LENGTH=226 /DNA_ID=CAMNT_0011774927 /DNA_START=9 /DNA_END=689 /DNA_ORIENTATION=+